jgi:hypothetical protein
MKLLQFNRDIHKRLQQHGYTHIEIRNKIANEHSWVPDTKDIQLLKALDRVDMLPLTAKFEPIHSEAVESLLSQSDLHCFIIVNDERL